MKFRIHILPLMTCFLFAGMTALASDPATPEMACSPGVGQLQDSGGICADPESALTPAVPEGSLQLLLPLQSSRVVRKDAQRAAGDSPGQPKDLNNKTIVYFFWGKGCPHCEEEKEFLDGLKRAQPSLEIREFEVWYHRENAGLMAAMLRAHGVRPSGVPVTFVDDRLFSGFTAQTRDALGKVIKGCSVVPCGDPAERPDRTEHPEQTTKARPFAAVTSAGAGAAKADTAVTIPLLGALDACTSSLPLLTLVIAGMDSFNPCAFFVLLSLLGILVHAGSRDKMFLIGGVFVFFSGFIYFLIMAAWLNLFLFMGHVAVITTIAGGVSLVIAGINIKDFFLFKQGLSLTIPDSAKPKLFDRMRRLLRSTSLVSTLIGATVLAVVANLYELLCTAGFPMVFTRILTLHNLSTATYYLYLVLYNIVYVIPLFIIVLGFTFTLGKRQLSEWQGRVLKLVSGAMMLGLGGVLLVNPTLLNNVMVSFIILLSALGVSLLTAAVVRRMG
jgi:thiol-disulfide isomerase/thioredoxin